MATKKKPVQKWTPTQLLYSVVGWLSTRKQPIVFGSNYNAAPIAELLGAVLKMNKLEGPPDNWPKIKVPVNLDHLTNKDDFWNPNAVAAPPPTPLEAMRMFMDKIRYMTDAEQDQAIALFLTELKAQRDHKFEVTEREEKNVQRQRDSAQAGVWNLEKIMRGDFLVVVKAEEPTGLVMKKASQ